ncbi:MAG: ATP-binding cassette domain-containing protein [Solobacterium sp.]|nr:ATP-binding cassette domain-containing protein [Solobacterium sp.]
MLQIRNLTITYNKDRRVLLDDFSLTLNSGDKAALIGEEGNGKSTLLKWIADPELISDYAEARGIRTVTGERIGYLPQELPEEDREKTVYAYLSEEERFTEQTPKDLARLAARMKLPADMFYSDQKLATLSGGEKVRIQTARILMKDPTVLLLDEPSNDLDIAMLEWTEQLIREFRGAVLFISHDEILIENTANRIVHLELLNRKTVCRHTIVNTGYREYMERRSDLYDRQMQKAMSERREEAERMERFRRIQQRVDHELNSVSRQDPHSGRLLKKKMQSVKSMEKRFERERENMTRIPQQEEAILFFFGEESRIPYGKKILDLSLKELKIEENVLARDIVLQISGPQKVCIIGRNGCGKSTLLKKIREELKERTDIRCAYMPQEYTDLLEMDQTPVQYLAPDMDRESVTRVRNLLGSMRYTTDEMEHPIRELSGGQKAKIFFLKMNLEHANVLILDEPTRNFSPLSQPVIRSVLKEFGGTIISVSHDRRYIAETTDTVFELTENGLRKLKGNDISG